MISVKEQNIPKQMGKRKTYTQEQIDLALQALKEGKTLRNVSQLYGVPKSTLYCKSKNISPVNSKMGPATILSEQEKKNCRMDISL